MKALRCRERLSSLEEARAMLLALKNRLEFTLATPAELLEELKTDERFKNCRYLHQASELTYRLGFEAGWSMALEQSGGELECGDIRLLSEIGSVLGKSDLETQRRQLELILERLSDLVTAAREQSPQKQKLYYSLGSLSGLAAAVMLL